MINLSSLIGFALGVGIIYASLFETGMKLDFFVNFHGIVIVLGGTIAAACISFRLTKILEMLKVFILTVLGPRKIRYKKTIEEIMELHKKASTHPESLREASNSIKHPFLKEAVELVAAGVLTEVEIRDALEQRVKTTEARFLHEANMFRTIGRFPPAFGLIATTLGMIALLQQLGTPGSEAKIGPAMSIGLVGTLYGIGLTNFFILPIAEQLTDRTEEEVALRKMIVEGAIMLKKQVNPVTMRENLNSFAPPKERVKRNAA